MTTTADTIQNTIRDLKARNAHALDITSQKKVHYELEEIIEIANCLELQLRELADTLNN